MEITNEERREVAERLRCNAQLCPNALFDLHETVGDSTYTLGGIATRLADLIDRPTCRKLIPDEMEGLVFCSNCGAKIGEYGVPNYCHNCGMELQK